MEAWATLSSRIQPARLLTATRDHVNDFWAHAAGSAVILFVSGCFAVLLHDALATAPAPPDSDEHSGQDDAPRLLLPGTAAVADDEISNQDVSTVRQGDLPKNQFEQDASPSSQSELSDNDSDPPEQNISLLKSNNVGTDLYKEKPPTANPFEQDARHDDPFRQDTQPINPSKHSDADCDLCEQDIPPTSPFKQDVLPIEPSDHGAADIDPFERDISPINPSEHIVAADGDPLEEAVPDKSPVAECICSEEKNALAVRQLLDTCVGRLVRIQTQLIINGDRWLSNSKRISGQGHPLSRWDFFHGQLSSQASPMADMLRGPMKNIPEVFPVTEHTKPLLSDVIEFSILLTESMDDNLPHHSLVANLAFDVNESTLTLMKLILSERNPPALGTFDEPIKLMKRNNALIFEKGTLIDNVLADHANFIAKRHREFNELELMTASDHIIQSFNVPWDWETLDVKNGLLVEGNHESSALRAREMLTSGPRSDAAAPADIVNNVYEISRTFRGVSKEVFEPTPEAGAPGSSSFGQVKNSPRATMDRQNAEEMKPLRKAQEDIEKLRVKVARMQRDRDISRKYQEDTVKEQESWAAAISSFQLQRLRRQREHNK